MQSNQTAHSNIHINGDLRAPQAFNKLPRQRPSLAAGKPINVLQ